MVQGLLLKLLNPYFLSVWTSSSVLGRTAQTRAGQRRATLTVGPPCPAALMTSDQSPTSGSPSSWYQKLGQRFAMESAVLCTLPAEQIHATGSSGLHGWEGESPRLGLGHTS